MANPLPAIIEALGATLDGWHPEDGKELTAFLDSLPEVIEKLQETVGGTLRDIIEDPANVYLISSEWAAEPADAIVHALEDARDAATELTRAYHAENDFWIGDD